MTEPLAHFPDLASAENTARDLDAIEVELACMSPWSAIRSIEAKWLGGQLSQDEALALITWHTERLSVEVCKIEARING